MSPPSTPRYLATMGSPTDETSSQLLWDVTNLVAVATSSAAWGTMITLYTMCFYSLFKNMTPQKRAYAIFYIILTTFMMTLGTISLVWNIKSDVQAYVLHRWYPGGPMVFQSAAGDSSHLVNSICWMALNNVVLGLVTWRMIVLYTGFMMYREWIVIALMLLYLACICTGILAVAQASIHHQEIFGPNMVRFALPYLLLVLAATFLVTTFVIAGMIHRRRRTSYKTSAWDFATIANMIVESAALHFILTALCVPLYIVGSPYFAVFFGGSVQVQIIASLLIILRDSRDRAQERKAAASVIVDSHIAGCTKVSRPSTDLESSTEESIDGFDHET